MTIEQAIQKAIEGGYDGTWFLYPRNTKSKNVQRQLFLDPSFWQSLGKAMGWEVKNRQFYLEPVLLSHEMLKEFTNNESANNERWKEINTSKYVPAWQYHWHRFIDHLAEGGSAETYFETLT